MASPPTTTTTVRVLSPAAHLLSPTRSASEAELAVRQTLAAALSPGSPSGSPSANGSRPAFSRKEDGTVSVPSVDGLEGEQRAALAGLWAARSELDSTAKLFLPSPSSSSVSSSAAASAVASALEDLSTLLADVQTVDTLVLSWQGVAYEGEELAFFSGKPAAELIGAAGSEEVVDDETVDGMVELWLALAALPSLSSTALGLSSFSHALLSRFLARLPAGARSPAVVHLTLRDCCNIPQAYSAFARERGVRLVSSSDPPQPIQPAALATIFEPYGSTLALPSGATPTLDWTLKYTVLHKARGVLIDKGYILSTSWHP